MWVKLTAIGAGAVTLFGCMAGVQASASPTGPAHRPAHAGAPNAIRPCTDHAVPRKYTHVIWIMMENHSFNAIIGSKQAPYINSLARKCGLATNYHNISHPSLPEYIAATSGVGYANLLRFDSDCNPTRPCVTSAPSIFGQGETWKSYEESMPSNCDRSLAGEYAPKHNPAPYYTTLKGCSKFDVPFTKLAGDLSHSRLPAFTFITPNLIDDMHDGSVATGDAWLATHVAAILNSKLYRERTTVLVITWDEGEPSTPGEHCATNTTDVSCRVATLVISPSTKPGTKSSTLFNHYSLLGTAEQLLGLPALGKAASFPTMTSAFHL